MTSLLYRSMIPILHTVSQGSFGHSGQVTIAIRREDRGQVDRGEGMGQVDRGEGMGSITADCVSSAAPGFPPPAQSARLICEHGKMFGFATFLAGLGILTFSDEVMMKVESKMFTTEWSRVQFGI